MPKSLYELWFPYKCKCYWLSFRYLVRKRGCLVKSCQLTKMIWVRLGQGNQVTWRQLIIRPDDFQATWIHRGPGWGWLRTRAGLRAFFLGQMEQGHCLWPLNNQGSEVASWLGTVPWRDSKRCLQMVASVGPRRSSGLRTRCVERWLQKCLINGWRGSLDIKQFLGIIFWGAGCQWMETHGLNFREIHMDVKMKERLRHCVLRFNWPGTK